MSIFDIVTAQNVRGFYEEAVHAEIPPLGEMLFPREKQLGLKLEFVKGRGGLPVVLKPSAFDVKSTVRDRLGLEVLSTKMPFFKESMLVKEEDRQSLLTMMQTGNQEYINIVAGEIFNDAKTLLDGAVSQDERMRMQLLTTGEISIEDNNVAYKYDYSMPVDHKKETAAKWSSVGTNIGKDILDWVMLARASGSVITRALTNSVTIQHLMANTAIKAEILANQGGGGGVVTANMVGRWMEAKYGITILLNDAMFINEEGDAKKYVPDDIFVLLPDGTLGTTVFGTTPEEADLLGGQAGAEVTIVNTGMAITTTKTTDPVNVETKVSMVALPSFEQIDKIIIADVSKGS